LTEVLLSVVQLPGFSLSLRWEARMKHAQHSAVSKLIPIKKVYILFGYSHSDMGDAAHPMTPFPGQGACLVIENAKMLVLRTKS
jgi:hypothetical protein